MTTKEYLEKSKKYPGPENKYRGWKKDLGDIKQFNKELLQKYPWLTPWNRWSGEKPENYDYEFTELDNMPDGWRLAFGDEMVERINQELLRFNYTDKYQIVQIKEKYGSLRWYDNGTPYKLSDDYRTVTQLGCIHYPPHEKDEVVKEDSREHYIPFLSEEAKSMSPEELRRYNDDAIIHYRIYKIVDECKVQKIIDEYEKKSIKTCIQCGEPAEWISKGWISPYCTDCAIKMHKKIKKETLETSFTRIEESLIEN